MGATREKLHESKQAIEVSCILNEFFDDCEVEIELVLTDEPQVNSPIYLFFDKLCR